MPPAGARAWEAGARAAWSAGLGVVVVLNCVRRVRGRAPLVHLGQLVLGIAALMAGAWLVVAYAVLI